jgi:hypothetical protein
MPEVHQVRQVSGLVRGDRRGDRDHLHERDRPFLHAGAPGGGQADHRQVLGGGSFGGSSEPLPRGHANRAAEEPELARGHRDPATAQQTLAGDH